METLEVTGKFRDGGSMLCKSLKDGKIYWLDRGFGHEKRGSLLYEGHPNLERYEKPVYGNYIIKDKNNTLHYSKLNQEDFISITPESKIKVTFHRTYELDPSVIHSRLTEEGYEDVEMTEELMKEKAEEIARDWLSDEMPEFVDNTPDFVSATVEVLD